MKAKTLFYVLMTSSLLLTLNIIGLICELIFTNHYWGIIPLVVLFGLTGYVGMEYGEKVRQDPQGAVDSFLGKTSIIILLVGLSIACNGQDNIYESSEFNIDSIADLATRNVDGLSEDVNGLGEAITVNILLEYKRECFNDSVLTKIIEEVFILEDGSIAEGITIGRVENQLVDKYIHKTPTFPDFLKWIEKRKNK